MPGVNEGRRHLLRRMVGQVADVLASGLPATLEETARPVARAPRPRPVPVIRPPGAVDEAAFLAGCTRCGDCITACPHDAIVVAGPRYRGAAGTPVIDPARSPCLMCEDTPCIPVCEPGVLGADRPRRIALAHIDTQECLAYRHQVCTTCADRCPVEGALRATRLKPTIDADVCTGCGVCQHVCPAPRNAVVIRPLLERQASPSPPQGAQP